MKEGTVSVLLGSHSVIHSCLVTLAWYKIHGRFPKSWELSCIFLHDIGHIGLNYLTDYDQKRIHWELGAAIANILFGEKGFDLIAGHCPAHNGHKQSNLYKPDKLSWHMAPKLWCLWNCLVEPNINPSAKGIIGNWKDVCLFKEQVRESIESGKWRETHDFQLERLKTVKEKKEI